MTSRTRILAFAATLMAGAAFADDGSRSVLQVRIETEDQRAAGNYWYAERLANAKPMPLARVDPAPTTPGTTPSIGGALDSEASPKAVSVILPGTPPAMNLGHADNSLPLAQSGKKAQPKLQTSNAAAAFGPYNNYRVPNVNMYPYSAVGKVFFTVPAGASIPLGDYSCTGSVFYDSHTVLTPRSCVYDLPTGVLFANFVFYPAYDNGPNPAYNNGWTVRNAIAWGRNYPSQEYDIGFLQLNDAAGFGCDGSSGTPPIWSYTGSLGVRYFGDISQYAGIMENGIGYPSYSPLDGQRMYQNVALTQVVDPKSNIVTLTNPQRGDVGGPWIAGFDPNNAANASNNTLDASNILTGLNSFQSTSGPLATNSPAFLASNLWSLFLSYSRLPCP